MTGRPAILVMARAPRPGRVKTRLQPLLGPRGTATLQAALIRHTVANAAASTPTYVAVDPPDAAVELSPLVAGVVGAFGQSGAHLGERMAAAVAEVFRRTRGPVVVIGTDAPTLTRPLLGEAIDAVAAGRVVIGPALDGGYYLLGVPRPLPVAFGIDPGLWGGPRVFAATTAALRRAGHDAALLAPLRDLDTPADADALRGDPVLPAAVATALIPGAVA